jgi:thioredoxin-related protein
MIMELIKFKQNNCTPCAMLDNYLNELGVKVDKVVNLTTGEVTDTVTGQTIKGDDAFMLAGKYSIMSTPTLVLVDDNGVEIERFSGVGRTGVNAILAKRGLI